MGLSNGERGTTSIIARALACGGLGRSSWRRGRAGRGRRRSNSSTRTSSGPAPIRAIFLSPTRPAKALRTRSPNCSRSKLGKSVGYTFYPDATGFIRNTLNAHRCDVVLGIAQGDDLVQPTNPYYRTSYAAAYPQDGPLKGMKSLERSASENGEDRHRRRHPAGDLSGRITDCLARSSPTALVVDTRYDSPTHDMMDDLDRGDIDVALLWGPLAGYYATKAKTPPAVVPLVKEQGGPRWSFGSSWGCGIPIRIGSAPSIS